MPLIAWISLLILTLCAVGSGVYWSIVWARVLQTQRGLPTARMGLGLPAARELQEDGPAHPPAPTVCVIIPAHNEQATIAGLATSLRLQDYPRFRVIFALDRCTDGTEAALRRAIDGDHRFDIVLIHQCPEGWAGKVHAIWSALQSPRPSPHPPPPDPPRDADLLLFADADTSFDPACIRACVALLQDRGLDMLSLLSTLTTDRWFETIVQPVAGMELLRQYPPLKANARDHARPFANGQFMLFRRAAYDAIGGHEVVKDELLEDIQLARHLRHKGFMTGLLMADGMLRCRMYSDFAAFRRGWKRIYIEGANRNPGRLRSSALRLTITGVILPLASMMAVLAGAAVRLQSGEAMGTVTAVAGLAALLIMFIALALAAALGSSRLEGILAYPLGAALVASILSEASSDLTKGKSTVWAGRSYHRPIR